jgi:hypothetical protein
MKACLAMVATAMLAASQARAAEITERASPNSARLAATHSTA